MSIIKDRDLNDSAILERYIEQTSGKSELRQPTNKYGQEEVFRCYKETRSLYSRSTDGTITSLDCNMYICLPDINIKQKDKVDGLEVHRVDKIKDFDGKLDHLEVYGYRG